MRGKPSAPEVKERLLKAAQDDREASYAQLGGRFSVHPNTARRWLLAAGLPARKERKP